MILRDRAVITSSSLNVSERDRAENTSSPLHVSGRGVGGEGFTALNLTERLYALTDLRFSVMALANPAGTIVERFRYEAHGRSIALAADFTPRSINLATSDGSAYAWENRYTGRELDLQTGLCRFRNRYYHAAFGRFISCDPLVYMGGMSLYRAYFVPVGMDPLGLWIIRREGSHTAIAIAEKGDTYESLAKKVGLRFDEIDKWASVVDDFHSLCPGDEVEIPNTVFFCWYGHDLRLFFLGIPDNGFGPDIALWRVAQARMREQGFHVTSVNGTDLIANSGGVFFGSDPADAEEKLKNGILEPLRIGTLNKMLHGFTFYGHGNSEGISRQIFYNEDNREGRRDGRQYFGASYDEAVAIASLSYKLGHVDVRACGGANSIKLFSNEPNGRHKYASGIHCPFFMDLPPERVDID